jgi:hypothetical protein
MASAHWHMFTPSRENWFQEMETSSEAFPNSLSGSPNICAWKVLCSMERSPVLTKADAPSFVICCFRRRQCVFIAFDLLFLSGKDLRARPLLERKAALKKLLRRKRSRILYLDHVERRALAIRTNRKVGFRRHCLQAEGFTIQGVGQAFAILDQGQEFAV